LKLGCGRGCHRQWLLLRPGKHPQPPPPVHTAAPRAASTTTPLPTPSQAFLGQRGPSPSPDAPISPPQNLFIK
jgi:hypothetical protein